MKKKYMNEAQIRKEIAKLEVLANKAADKCSDRYDIYMTQIEELNNDLYDIAGYVMDVE